MNNEATTTTPADPVRERWEAHLLGNYFTPPLTLVRGQGSYVWDAQGRRYLDFTTGIAVNALGHCHPAWTSAIAEQATRLGHCSNLFANPLQPELAERINGYAGRGRLMFCNSGAEANEALIKLSRLHARATGRGTAVVCAENGFHGRTFGGMSATPQTKVRQGFEPLLPGFRFGQLNRIESFERLLDEGACAVFVETVQGEGGIFPCEPGFLQDLRHLCDERGALLLLDEVQCGIGRSGRFFAFEHAGIRPDAIGMAKGLGGGMPIGAIWVAEGYAGYFQPGSHGTTFGGNPLACAAALAVIDTLEEAGLLARVQSQSAPWHEALRALVGRYPGHLEGLRGLGYMVGLVTRSPSRPWVARLREAGLLAPPAGTHVLRLLPPLTASAEELQASVEIVDRVLAESPPA